MSCSLCQIPLNGLDGLKDGNEKTSVSGKSVNAIINYLAKTAKPPLDKEWAGQCVGPICKICFDDISTYDEYMVKLLQLQRRILSCFRNQQRNEYIMSEPLDECTDIDVNIEEIEISIQNKEFSDIDDDNNEIYQCSNDNEIEAHTIVNDRDDFDPVVCETALLDEHFDSTHINRRYKIQLMCKYCNKLFKNNSQLRRHISVVHKTSKQIWKCEICGITTKDEEYLELHRNIHEGKSDLECRYCSKRYTRKINVIRHMQKHWDKKKFQCERCGLRFSERPIYYNHRLQHDAEEDPLICSVCNQSFKTRRTYRNHLWVHREDRPRYGCEICGKTFVEKYTLKVHQRCHSDKEEGHKVGRRKNEIRQEEKIFECIICGVQFSSQDQSDKHMKDQHDVILKAESIFI